MKDWLKTAYFDWNPEKNMLLYTERGVCFEEVVAEFSIGNILTIDHHPNPQKYPNQYIAYIRIHWYVHAVPFVRDGDTAFLKTIIPTRKANKKYS